VSEQGQPATLHYSAPRVFFERRFHFRSLPTTVQILATAGFGAAFAYAAWSHGSRAAAGSVSFNIAIITAIVAVVCFAYLGHYLRAWVANRVDAVRLTEEGIERGTKVWRWERVAVISGQDDMDGIWLLFEPRSEGRTLIEPLRTSPLLTAEQFSSLTAKLSRYLRKRHPHVIVEKKPRRPS
jgi:hypothetical protein